MSCYFLSYLCMYADLYVLTTKDVWLPVDLLSPVDTSFLHHPDDAGISGPQRELPSC